MGFFSKLFGRNKNNDNNVETVNTTEDNEVFDIADSVTEIPIVIEPVTKDEPTVATTEKPKKASTTTKKTASKKTAKKSLDVDFHSEIVTDSGSPVVKITVEGSKGPRVYTKEFDNTGDACEFISSTSTRIIDWLNQGKTLYQAMSYLNMTRIS